MDKKDFIFLEIGGVSQDKIHYSSYWYYNGSVYYIVNYVTTPSGYPIALGDEYNSVDEYKKGILENFENIFNNLGGEKEVGISDNFRIAKVTVDGIQKHYKSIEYKVKSIERKKKIEKVLND